MENIRQSAEICAGQIKAACGACFLTISINNILFIFLASHNKSSCTGLEEACVCVCMCVFCLLVPLHKDKWQQLLCVCVCVCCLRWQLRCQSYFVLKLDTFPSCVQWKMQNANGSRREFSISPFSVHCALCIDMPMHTG